MTVTAHPVHDHDSSQSVAIIGMAGRFPEARNLDQFWQNLRGARECIRTFERDQLLAAGVREEHVDHPDFVPRRPYLEGIEHFDHGYFGFTPKEASMMDPQHRMLLETAVAAFEHAGYGPDQLPEQVAVYAGTGENGYLWYNLGTHRDLIESMGGFPAMIGNGKDYLATRISYKLNLRGPSMTVQTACSTSLVAVHLACQSLLNGECDMAVAGAVSLALPPVGGYLFQPEGIVSSDGHCRSFDDDADGTLFGSGAGAVILKRLDDAVRDGDAIQAVILGCAVNNDGAGKVGFSAPGVQGQADVIAEALGVAGVAPGQISYVEAHGSATRLGDPVELRALEQAFAGVAPGQCALGSVKSNIGHVNTAAGMAGLLKTVLGLQHGEIPATINVRKPSTLIDWDVSPFRLNRKTCPWLPLDGRRIAGVSSFGLGGTNAHVIVEQAPPRAGGASGREPQLLVLSARSETSLQEQACNLATHLEHYTGSLADAAYTLQTGRKSHPYRRALVAATATQAAQQLRQPAAVKPCDGASRPVAFMFAGVGERYASTVRNLYDTEPVFRRHLDACCAMLAPLLDVDVRALLWEAHHADGTRLSGAMPSRLDDTRYAQPALFAVEYSLAQLWLSWGIAPQALIGHSLGEYVAATLSGVFNLADALRLVAARAKLISELPAGAMLALPLDEQATGALLRAGLSLAAVNAPELCVVSGTLDAVAALEMELAARGIAARRLAATHAFHSTQMEAVRPALLDILAGLDLQPPTIALMSNLNADWLTADQARSPTYWADHMCAPVRFAQGVTRLAERFSGVLLEVGPAQSVGVFARQQLMQSGGAPVYNSLPHVLEQVAAQQHALLTLGKLWMEGVTPDWRALHGADRRCRVSLPGTAFERHRHWIEPAAQAQGGLAITAPASPLPASAAALVPPQPESAPCAPAQSLLAIYRDLLGLDEIRPDQSFFELGGHSLLAVQLISRVRELFGVRLQLATLFQAPSVNALLPLLERPELARQQSVDFWGEAKLDDDICPAKGQAAPAGAPRRVLLTGATGFLGAFVLQQLLLQTDAEIFCLVRAPNPAEGRVRVERNARNYKLLEADQSLPARVQVMCGDVAQVRLGLDPDSYRSLAHGVQAVFHVAAWVNWIYPYTALKQANVEGTREVLRFACAGTLKRVHHVSSTAVFDVPTYPESNLPDETFDLRTLDYSQGMLTGYAVSKWVAEQLVAQARTRGIPASVYRAAYVAGDSRTGACNTGDFIYRMTKGCIELGMVPDIHVRLNVAPVDFVARGLVGLALSNYPAADFHVMNSDTSYWQDVIGWIGTLGYRLQRVSYEHWMACLAGAPDNALYPLIPYLPEHFEGHDDGSAQGRLVDCSRTTGALAELGMRCPPADAQLLATYHRFMLERGFLSAAPAPAMEG
jgi:thioester reductase-like protein